MDKRDHITTDPACVLHQPPVTRWQRWRARRAHGRMCFTCARRRLTGPRPGFWSTVDEDTI